MANTYLTLALAVCALVPAYGQLPADEDDNIIIVDGEPHVKESEGAQMANLWKSKELQQEIQAAARQCSTIAWKITYIDANDEKVTHFYPFTPEEVETAREIFLTRAHPVMADYTIHPCRPLLFYSISFLDASGEELASISSDSLGRDSNTSSNGYQYGARISVPDEDRAFLSNAGNKEKRDKDAERFYKEAR